MKNAREDRASGPGPCRSGRVPAARRCCQRQALDIARQLLVPVGADAEPEVLGGHVLELVRFVHDRAAACGNHFAEGVLPDGRIGAEQMMVDDHDVGGRRPLAHPRHETVVVARTFGAEARFGGGRHLVPERDVFRKILDLGAVAGFGRCRPLADDRQEYVMTGASRPPPAPSFN